MKAKEESADFEAIIEETLPGGAVSWMPSLGRYPRGMEAFGILELEGET